jgi:predicted Zn-dependent protease
MSLAAVVMTALACQTTPETGRSQLIFFDQKTEFKMGAQAYREILKESTISSDRRAIGRVRTVGEQIAQAAHVSGFTWEFTVVEEDSPNAYCLPGGKVGVHTGIFPIALNDAGLAAVIGHEVGHAVARHGAERMSHAVLLGVAGEVLAQGLPNGAKERELFRLGYGLTTAVAVTLPFSRSHELEADQMGLIYMARAGYDPREAVAFWRRFAAYAKKSKSGAPIEFLSTHPADERRINLLESVMNQAMAEYEKAPKKRGSGQPLL